VATPDGGDDLIWIGGPSEGPWIVVGLGEKAVDGGLEVDDRLEHAAFEPSFGKLGEEALGGVQPAGRDRSEVENPMRMAAEPGMHLRVLMDGIVVENGVGDLTGRDLRLDGVQEADELLMPVASDGKKLFDVIPFRRRAASPGKLRASRDRWGTRRNCSRLSDVPKIVAGLRVGQSFGAIPVPQPPVIRRGASGTFYDKGLEGARAITPSFPTSTRSTNCGRSGLACRQEDHHLSAR
jgi:hypothetical protein